MLTRVGEESLHFSAGHLNVPLLEMGSRAEYSFPF